jgi:5-methylcytosine-specific restriction enzyme A
VGKVCLELGCPELAVDERGRCARHKREANAKKKTQRSAEGAQQQEWYRSKKWKARRDRHLAAHPFCQCPEHKGKRVPGDVVDHVIPPRGNAQRFWFGRLQTLTKTCHDVWKQRQEKMR